MRPMTKDDFFALAIQMIEAGHVPQVFDQRYNMTLGYVADNGAEISVQRIADPDRWSARDTLRQRFNKWLAEIAASARCRTMYAENQARAQKARDAENASRFRRYHESAHIAIAGIDNLLANLAELPADVGFRFSRDVANLREFLKSARKSAINLRDRSVVPKEV